MKQVIARADTMVWQAFENPTHDMANHTAVVTLWTGTGGKRTVFVELDVSAYPAVGVRKGIIINEVVIPQDPSMDGFFECVGEGAVGAAVGCTLTNCGYLHCLGGGTAGAVIVCGIKSLFFD